MRVVVVGEGPRAPSLQPKAFSDQQTLCRCVLLEPVLHLVLQTVLLRCAIIKQQLVRKHGQHNNSSTIHNN